MAAGPSVRAFIAIPVEEELRCYLRALVSPVARLAGPAVHWMAPEQFHLTLAFLGDLAPAQVSGGPGRLGPGAVVAEAARRFVPFDCAVSTAGFFPPVGRPRVLWFGVEPEEPLRRLAAAVRSGLAGAALPFDRRPFRAHLTMGRVRFALSAECVAAWKELGRGLARASTSPGTPGLRVAEVVTYQSLLGPAGPRYAALARAALAGP